MKLQECYALFGGDFKEVLGRLASERLIEKFLLRFLSDHSYEDLCAAMAESDADTAFRMAHTLKGVCQNLGFTPLGDASAKLCDALRGGTIPTEAAELLSIVTEKYVKTAEAIRAYQAEKEV